MSVGESFPSWRQVVLGTTDPRGLAEFYRRLLGFAYRPGDEPPSLATTTSEAATGSSSALLPVASPHRVPAGRLGAGDDLAGAGDPAAAPP